MCMTELTFVLVCVRGWDGKGKHVCHLQNIPVAFWAANYKIPLGTDNQPRSRGVLQTGLCRKGAIC